LTSEFLQKIGAILLSTEEGTDFVNQQLRKHAGAQKAEELMGFIYEQNAEAEKIAAMEQGSADANALIDQLTYQAGFSAGQATHDAPAEKEGEKKEGAEDKQDDPSLATKLGQEVAGASIEDLMGGAGGEMDVPPEAMMGGAEMGGAEMGGEEEFTPEDVAAALEMLVQEGELDPQDAQAILDQIGAGGADMGGEEMGGGEPPPPPAEGGEQGGGDEGVESEASSKDKGSDDGSKDKE
jgi:hypothetical protein